MYHLIPVSCMEKVLTDRRPSGEGFSGHMTALRGETISFQIAYFHDGMTLLRGAAEASAGVRVRYVDSVPCAYPCHTGGRTDSDYLSEKPGLYPDILRDVPACGFPMLSCSWGALWVDIAVPADAEPGLHSARVDVRRLPDLRQSGDAGEPLGSIELQYEVLRHVLPALPIPHTEWFHCDCLANYYGVEVFSEEHWRILENFLKSAADHHCNMILTPIFTPPLDTAFGGERRTVQLVDVAVTGSDSYHFGFDRLRRWIALCRGLGFRYFEISHLFSQWGAVAAPKIMGEKDGALCQLFGWDTDAAGPEYRSFLHQLLPALRAELSSLGVLEDCWFHISDEPSMEQLESYRLAYEGVSRELAGCHIMDALSDYSFYEKGLVETPICATNHIAPFLAKRPPRLFAYYCTAQWEKVSNRFIAQPGYRTRVLGMQLFKENIDGFLQWAYNFYNSEYSFYPIDPFSCTDAGGAFPSGDPFLVYPGPDRKPIDSLRLMLIDAAFSDYCALHLLAEKIGRKQAVAVLDPGNELAIDRYPMSAGGIQTLRNRVNEKLRELQ
ncbi:DUF4091 domain-containing protein [Lachnoclostridium sp. Marseille-P6806]|uniref:DUF4091 domain-containing protein n=1 Tax=Lachnoclostridium sp. Marseille-P6806 TaxID=2364793 RepID=UPI00102F9A76|nr:DUF4091 domain-containing protein [Lachnoclostridium sp. Marseille-P6806]